MKIDYQRRLELMQQIADKSLTQKDVALELGIGIRRVKYLFRDYKELGAEAMLNHGNKGRPPANKKTDEERKKIFEYSESHQDETLQKISENILNLYGIEVHSDTVSKILQENGVAPRKRGGSKPGHAQPAPSTIKELDIAGIEDWITEIEAEMSCQDTKNEKLQNEIKLLRNALSIAGPKVVDSYIKEIKAIRNELSSSHSKLSKIIKNFKIYDYQKR